MMKRYKVVLQCDESKLIPCVMTDVDGEFVKYSDTLELARNIQGNRVSLIMASNVLINAARPFLDPDVVDVTIRTESLMSTLKQSIQHLEEVIQKNERGF